MTTRVRLRGEVTLVGHTSRWRRFPLRQVQWLEDPATGLTVPADAAPAGRYRSPITMPGYNAGVAPRNKGKRFPASPPSPEEMLRLLDLCDPKTKRGVRNRALLVTLWRSGLRISEALALLPHEIDFTNRTVTVMSGKGSKRRVSGIDQGGLLEISRWLMVRAMLRVPEGSPLFCTVNAPSMGNRVHPAYVRGLLRTFRVRAKIPHRMAPHQLRHAHACELAREGTPIHLVSRQLGHSNLATTANYLAGISPQEVIDAISVRQWPGTGA
jgi:integrase